MVHDTHPPGELLTARVEVLLSQVFISGIRLVLILVVALLLWRAIRLLTDKLNGMLQEFTHSVERQKRAQTLSYSAYVGATTVLFIVTTMLVLEELGMNIGPLLATAGIGGLAIGFGAQNLVRDVISGFFILLEDQIRIGDVVKVGDKGGLVEGTGLRVLRLRDFDGSVHMIPNGTITTITNMTKDFSYLVLSVSVAEREDIDKVIAVLQEVGTALRHDPEFAADILEDLEIAGVDDAAAARLTIRVRLKTLPVRQWRISYELRRRIKRSFEAHGIESPAPP
jgi:small conductance mechanosensitive channel